MPTIASSSPAAPHRARALAESFGADPARYDRTRPAYPQELVDRIVAASPGSEMLDVGIGTGTVTRSLEAAGCRVLGVEIDPRMAAFARERGFDVEVAPFEQWPPAGRTFDAVVAGQTWHWIDPVAGAAKAARLLRDGGPLAAFWNVQRPPRALARAFTEVYRRLLPGTPFAADRGDALDAHDRVLGPAIAGIEASRAFDAVERWRLDWTQHYTTQQWLDQVPSFGGHSRLPAATLDRLLAGIGDAIDRAGGGFAMDYATVAIVARRRSRDQRDGA